MQGINFDPLADDGMAEGTMPQGDVQMRDDGDDGVAEVGHGHGGIRRHADDVPDDGPDDLDRRNRLVMLIDRAVSVIGVVLCIACVAITANMLISPLGL